MNRQESNVKNVQEVKIYQVARMRKKEKDRQ